MEIKWKLLLFKLSIQSKLFKALSILIKLFGYVVVGLIYTIIFGGILALFAIPIVLLFKLI